MGAINPDVEMRRLRLREVKRPRAYGQGRDVQQLWLQLLWTVGEPQAQACVLEVTVLGPSSSGHRGPRGGRADHWAEGFTQGTLGSGSAGILGRGGHHQ